MKNEFIFLAKNKHTSVVTLTLLVIASIILFMHIGVVALDVYADSVIATCPSDMKCFHEDRVPEVGYWHQYCTDYPSKCTS